MGEVKDAVKGSGPPARSSATPGNLNTQVQSLIDEVSRLTAIKDEDIIRETAAEKPENERKAATLRSVSSLLRASKRLLEDY